MIKLFKQSSVLYSDYIVVASTPMDPTVDVIMTIYGTVYRLSDMYLTSASNLLVRPHGMSKLRVPTPVADIPLPCVGAHLIYLPTVAYEAYVILCDLSSDGGMISGSVPDALTY